MVDERHGQLVSLESAVPPCASGSALLDLLRSVRTEIQLSYRADGPVAGLLPPGDRAWLASTGFGLFSPLLGSPGTLLGVVGIGEGVNGLPYTERDCMLITAMSGQAALKLENSRLRERTPPLVRSGVDGGRHRGLGKRTGRALSRVPRDVEARHAALCLRGRDRRSRPAAERQGQVPGGAIHRIRWNGSRVPGGRPRARSESGHQDAARHSPETRLAPAP